MIIRHNEIRDVLAGFLSETCHDVSVEPTLQPLTGEPLSLQSANTDEHARLDVAASGIWGDRFERTFFDVRVFNPYAPSNQTPQIQASYRKHENEKRRKYEQRVVEIEHSTFIPFVLACTGGVGPAATLTLKRVGNLLAEKHNSPYSHVMGFLRNRLSFALLRSTLMCLRGTRSSKSQPFNLHSLGHSFYSHCRK